MSSRLRAALLVASAALLCAPVSAQPPAPPPASPPSIERLDPALDAIIAPNTPIERVATGFEFTEGPVWHRGRLYFSDVRGDKLRTVTRDGKVELIADNAGGLADHPPGASIGPNGMVPAADGSILMVQMGARRIARLDAQGRIQPFISDYQGKRLNSPNDLVYDKDGALWFTDPPFGLFNGMDKDPAKQLPFNAVFRYANGRLEPVITDMPLPNGIGFSPDYKTLYVANYSRPDMYIRAYDVGAGGKLSAPRVVVRFPASGGPGGADGLKIDSAGNIWATGPGGIRIVTPQGKILGQIKLPEVAANLAFGEDGHSVYITASTSIYRLHSKVKGEIPMYSEMK
ncbi:SMP-30/gluconolactonase/LRE family protein [Sphingomonas quercus]|uniref:SMP-30/gluconolactonase/LRE family protein n=1 Tax=Sphingomonas quercus TaxID=2842451 RepID=A0ABS6BJW7_9SPHN|nr:SMP-30/gluconolactonase/LRE family protein [Sphingomonas quercus]MBU3077544.1 SMP-30/gluconolactonase/LRE family protein [Sphingomonas quercus]